MKRKKKKTRKGKLTVNRRKRPLSKQAKRAAKKKRAAAQKRRQQRARDAERYDRDRAEWKAAFASKHGHAPGDMDEFMDYTYTWRQRYAAVSPAAMKRDSRLAKLHALANDPGATPGERATARLRIAEIESRRV